MSNGFVLKWLDRQANASVNFISCLFLFLASIANLRHMFSPMVWLHLNDGHASFAQVPQAITPSVDLYIEQGMTLRVDDSYLDAFETECLSTGPSSSQ